MASRRRLDDSTEVTKKRRTPMYARRKPLIDLTVAVDVSDGVAVAAGDRGQGFEEVLTLRSKWDSGKNRQREGCLLNSEGRDKAGDRRETGSGRSSTAGSNSGRQAVCCRIWLPETTSTGLPQLDYEDPSMRGTHDE